MFTHVTRREVRDWSAEYLDSGIDNDAVGYIVETLTLNAKNYDLVLHYFSIIIIKSSSK